MTEFLDRLAGRVAVVGSGLAGLMMALALAPRPVVLITRAGLGEETSSAWAQGGLAAAIGADDAVDLHLADTLAAGAGLCGEAAASAILARAPDLVARLEAFGVRFDRDDDGAYALGLEAAHSRRRILHAEGDSSGAAIIRPLIAAVKNTPSIAVLSSFEVRRLVMRDGKIAGLLGNHAGGDFEAEGLFARARERGFERHGGPLKAMTTRPSLITRWPERAMKLDWFLSRGLRMVDCAILPSVDAEGRTLSDHDVIHARIEGFI